MVEFIILPLMSIFFDNICFSILFKSNIDLKFLLFNSNSGLKLFLAVLKILFMLISISSASSQFLCSPYIYVKT